MIDMLGAGGDDDHEMSEAVQVEVGSALRHLPLGEVTGRKNVNDESGGVGIGIRVDVDDAGGLFLLEVLNKSGVELLGMLLHLLARVAVRNGHQQAMFARHLHASDDSFQLLSFQTHSLIDPETSGRVGSRQRSAAGRHGSALFRRQGETSQISISGHVAHLNKGEVVF